MAQSVELVGLFYNKAYKLPREKDIHSRGGAALFYDAMMKIGVMKAERVSTRFIIFCFCFLFYLSPLSLLLQFQDMRQEP